MTAATLLRRSLAFHWRAHAGVLLGAMVATAVLVGALAVGDSVRAGLRAMALERIGPVHVAMAAGSRFFRTELEREIADRLDAPAAAVIHLRATAASDDGARRSGRVQVIGIGRSFDWASPAIVRALAGSPEPGVVLSRELAVRLDAAPGEEVVLRIEKPSLLSRDAPLSTIEDATVALRLPVVGIAGPEELGRFGLEANQLPALNAFVTRETLQEQIRLPGRANLLLVGAGPRGATTAAQANTALWAAWTLADAALEVRDLPGGREQELRSPRVFLDPPAGQAALQAAPDARGVLAYFVNALNCGGRSTPYSVVAAMRGGAVPADLGPDEIVLNQWLADDLRAGPGDRVTLAYTVVGPGRRLVPQSRAFRVRAVIPMTHPSVDPTLMPEFPGVSEAENCRDWRPGIPIDLDRIRDKDEAYWDRYRGAPKAFVRLETGQELWGNRFGNLTAVRYRREAPAPAGLEARLREALNPAAIGLFFLPVREAALESSRGGVDFGQLFLGFSFFLILSALILTGLLFALGAEQRGMETGILLAMGFQPGFVRRMLLLEGVLLSVAGAIPGALAGLLYTRALIAGLATIWSGAVAGAALPFHYEPATVLAGAAAGTLVSALAVWLVARRQARTPARALLTREPDAAVGREAVSPRRRARTAICIVVLLVGALALAASGAAASGQGAAGSFFGAGFLLLAAGILSAGRLLTLAERSTEGGEIRLSRLSVRNAARRWGRSLAVIGLFAAGSFLVAAVAANRHDPAAGAESRASGTGGFAFYGETTLPVYQRLDTPEGLAEFGLAPEDLGGMRVVSLRLREGDEASCLNLNRAHSPRLLGVPAGALEPDRFTFAGREDRGPNPWAILEEHRADGAVPAIGDQNTVLWSMGKALGAVVPFVNERGEVFTVRIAGILAGSVLQGGLLISETHFIRHYPGHSGYQVFLLDGGPLSAAARGEKGALLTDALQDVGLDLMPAAERLLAFQAVENTYLSIFGVLGGLGVLLGSLGLGVIVLRNVLERRAELAVLRAVGFRRRTLVQLVVAEHLALLGVGLGVGVIAALLAAYPALSEPGAGAPVGQLGLTLAAVLISGAVWTWGAAALALRGPLLTAIRGE